MIFTSFTYLYRIIINIIYGSYLLFIIALYSSKVTLPSSLMSASLIISSTSLSVIDTLRFFANAFSSSCVTNPSPSLSYLLNISSSSLVKSSSIDESQLKHEIKYYLLVCKFFPVITSPGPAYQECTGSCHENVPALKAVSSGLQ